MLGITARNFLKIGNSWALVEKHATTLVYVGTHFFPQFLENSRSHTIIMHVVPWFPRKNTNLLNKKGTDDSMENDEKCEIVIGA